MERLRRESKRRLRRLLRKRAGETDVVVFGRFSLFMMTASRYAKSSAVVIVRGRRFAAVHQMRRGPEWIPLSSGRRHELKVYGMRGSMAVKFSVKLKEGEKQLLFIEPAGRHGAAIVKLFPLDCVIG